MSATLYVGPDGRLERRPSSTVPRREEPITSGPPSSAAGKLARRAERFNRRYERNEYERDVYEILRDAELGRLGDTRFCPVCRSEVVDLDALNADETAPLACEVCGYRGALSTFNVY